MSILTENSKKMLVESMRECLSEVLHESTSLTSKQATEKIKFVTESATYEQLLNITLNPRRQEKYQPAYVLEGAVAILHSACMTGRKHIGINAITEGALKLQKKTGAVITESMLDAALLAVNEGAGLKIVGKLLNEAFDPATQAALDALTQYQANLGKSGVAIDKVGMLNALRGIGIRGSSAENIINGVTNGDDIKRLVSAEWSKNIADAAQKMSKSGLRAGSVVTPQQIRALKRAGIDVTTAIGKDGKLISDLSNVQRHALSSVRARGQQAASSGLRNAVTNGMQNKAGTPWGKYALGAAAIGGLGALGYQYYKNRKAMNRDIQNGIEE